MPTTGQVGRARAALGYVFYCFMFVAAAAAASWPTFVNGQPFLLSDTVTYIREADAAIYKLTGSATDWTQRYVDRFETSRAGSQENAMAPGAKQRPVIISGRSIYYGAFLYTMDRLAGLRFAAFAQALLAVACIYGTFRRFAHREKAWVFLLLVGGLSAISSLAYFSSYLVPDLFAALAILAAAHLCTARPPLSRRALIFWTAVACLSALFHSANIAILAVILMVAVGTRLLRGSPAFSRLSLIALSIFVGVAGERVFDLSVEHQFGSPPVRPPFLAARLIADGPGVAYLRETCPSSGFDLCRYIDRFPTARNYPYSDTFLWSADPRIGAFSAVEPDERRRMAAEETRFAVAVLKAHPVAVIENGARDVAAQAIRWGLSDFNDTAAKRDYKGKNLPARVMREQRETPAFRETMPVEPFRTLTLITALASLVLIARAFRTDTDKSAQTFVAVLLVGIVANVIICGSLSTPHDRYLMRVAWLLPLGVFVIAAVRSTQTSRSQLPTDRESPQDGSVEHEGSSSGLPQ